jgi:hypothetical protein
MVGKIFSYLFLVGGLMLIIYGISELSFYSILSIVALSVGIGFVGVAGMALFTSRN